ncbi:hypothetical protein D3C83_03240 [compost metagenome]
MHHHGRHRVVSPPVRGQQLGVRVDGLQAGAGVFVEIVEVRIAAQHEEQALGDEPGAQINLRAGDLPSVRAHPDHQRGGQSLRAHDELKGLARLLMQLQRTPVGGQELAAVQRVAAGDNDFQLAEEAGAAIGHRDVDGCPVAGPEGVGEPHHRRDVHGPRGRRRRRAQEREQQQHAGQALSSWPRAACPASPTTAPAGAHVAACGHALL